jgi:hypothetical protein
VSTEASTTDTVRSFATAAWLAAQTDAASQAWSWTNATILTPAVPALPGQPVTVTLQVADTNLSAARITWEAQGQEPTFGNLTYGFTPGTQEGPYWIEAEVQWPDGRRAFASNQILVSTEAPPQLSDPVLNGASFSFQLLGTPQASYVVQASTDLLNWQSVVTNALPVGGAVSITDPSAGGFSRRYYRAIRVP